MNNILIFSYFHIGALLIRRVAPAATPHKKAQIGLS